MSPLIVGHRGASGTHPENTKASILAAAEMGSTWVEIDVQPTKDGVLVVNHDHTVDRCSDGAGRVDAHTLDELRQLDFGGWFGTEFSNERILTLDEMLELCEQHDLGINIEVKVDTHDTQSVVEKVVDALAKTSLDKDKILLSSFNHDIMRLLHKHCSSYKLGVISKRLSASVWALLQEIEAYSCHLYYRWASATHIKKLQNSGYQVWCYTVNTPHQFKNLNKVDAIFSNYPTRFLNQTAS
ncbi:glycerophosphoryl diester phosphodiesterase [Vibrio sp. S4M6]|uniref:glycerophosphoryl diester phosphodiesterase n=1 Tax=Vibrio sinus TaxID=2946865 RepID=UPI002029FD7E|nr:glycerophosphoryl diester phosphodiesterase [Vibrio sinus]MCL9781269.1 glycerophosphoryl diester phosphodiesterase [Vibrio sinus]